MACANHSMSISASSFQIWQQSTGWSCDGFSLASRDSSLFSVSNSAALQVYGYSVDDALSTTTSSSTTSTAIAASTSTKSADEVTTTQPTTSVMTTMSMTTVSTESTSTATSSDTTQHPSSTISVPDTVTASSVKYTTGVAYKNFYNKPDSAMKLPSSPDHTFTVYAGLEEQAVQSCADLCVMHGYNTFTLDWLALNYTGLCYTYFASYDNPALLTPDSSNPAKTSAYSTLVGIGPDDLGGPVAPSAYALTNPSQSYDLLYAGLGWFVDTNKYPFDSSKLLVGVGAQIASQQCLDYALGMDSPSVSLTLTAQGWRCWVFSKGPDALSFTLEQGDFGDVYSFTLSQAVADKAPSIIQATTGDTFTKVAEGVGLIYANDQTYYQYPTPASDPIVLSEYLEECADYMISMRPTSILALVYIRATSNWICSSIDTTSYDPSKLKESRSLALGDSYVYAVSAG